LCGAKPPDVKLEVDHKTPVSLGGKDDTSNLWTVCFECNRGKSNVWDDGERSGMLVGKWFHSWTIDRRIAWQGRVADYAVDANMFLVDTLDWFCGDFHSQRLVSTTDMKNWTFYESAEEMRAAWEEYAKTA